MHRNLLFIMLLVTLNWEFFAAQYLFTRSIVSKVSNKISQDQTAPQTILVNVSTKTVPSKNQTQIQSAKALPRIHVNARENLRFPFKTDPNKLASNTSISVEITTTRSKLAETPSSSPKIPISDKFLRRIRDLEITLIDMACIVIGVMFIILIVKTVFCESWIF